MALEITGMTRSLTFKKGNGMVTLDGPDPSDSPEMIMNHYSNFYPELTTATVHGPVLKDDKAMYELETTVGAKRQDIRGRTGEKKTRNHVYHWTNTDRNSWQGSSPGRHGGRPDAGWTGKSGSRFRAGP